MSPNEHAPICQCGECQQRRLVSGLQPLNDPQPELLPADASDESHVVHAKPSKIVADDDGRKRSK